MKHCIAIIACAFLFAVAGCSQSPTNTAPASKVNDLKHPTTPGESVTDIATPSFTGNTITAGTVSGHKVHLTWQSNSPNAAWSYSQDPTSPNDLNDGHGWEYWGTGQLTIVISPHYSGHYELRRVNPDNSETGLGDITADTYDDDNLADGTYTYYLKAKSQEKDDPNNAHSSSHEHHSLESDGYSVTIQSCVENQIANSYAINPVTGGNGSWNSTGTTWTANSSGTHQNANFMFNINEWTNTQNSCTQAITATPVSGGYTGTLYLSRDGGVTWRLQSYSSISGYYQSNGNNPGGTGAGLGKFNAGTYTIIYSSTASTAGQLGTFTLVQN
jgi:hypothetical protein